MNTSLWVRNIGVVLVMGLLTVAPGAQAMQYEVWEIDQ